MKIKPIYSILLDVVYILTIMDLNNRKKRKTIKDKQTIEFLLKDLISKIERSKELDHE